MRRGLQRSEVLMLGEVGMGLFRQSTRGVLAGKVQKE